MGIAIHKDIHISHKERMVHDKDKDSSSPARLIPSEIADLETTTPRACRRSFPSIILRRPDNILSIPFDLPSGL